MIVELSAALSSLKTATELAKTVRDIGMSLEQAEYKLKLAELIEKLADAKMGIAVIQGEIESRDGTIKELNEQLRIKNLLKYESPYYWIVDGDHKDGPYCQQCYESAGKLVHLQPRSNFRGLWDCKSCKSFFEDRSYSPQFPRVLTRRKPLA